MWGPPAIRRSHRLLFERAPPYGSGGVLRQRGQRISAQAEGHARGRPFHRLEAIHG